MPFVIVSSEVDPTSSADLAAALGSAGRDVSLDARGPVDLNQISTIGHELADRWVAAPPDAVLAHGWQAGLAVQIAAQERSIRIVQRFGGLASKAADPKRARLESALARGATRVIASHAGQVEQLVALGVRRGDIRSVPYGVDVNVFNEAGPAWPLRWRRRIITAASAADMASVAGIVNMLASLPEAELVVLGLAPEDPAAQGLVRLAQRDGVANRLTLPGKVPAAERAAVLRSCDVAVSTTAEDTAASFVLEAMACGVPVCARAVGPAADAVADSVTGVLVPGTAPELLAEFVRGLLGDAMRRESFGLAAVDRARARFNWALAAAATARILDEVAMPPREVTLPRQDSVHLPAAATSGARP